MILLALDLGRSTGVAYGDPANGKPKIETWELALDYGEPKLAAGMFGARLRDQFRNHPRPDRIVVEEFMAPAASENQNSTIAQILLHGGLHFAGGIYRIPITALSVGAARKHFCGKSTALPRTKGRKRTQREKKQARDANKKMVLDRAKLLGYVPRSCEDDNQSDAAALWDWGMVHLAGVIPQELHLF